MLPFKQFIYEQSVTPRHKGENSLFSGFNSRPRKTMNIIANKYKDELAVLPAITKIKKNPKAVHVCTPSDISYINQHYSQLDLENLPETGSQLGNQKVKISRIPNSDKFKLTTI